MEKFILNKELIIIEEDKKTEKIILQNSINSQLISLSIPEYDIIKFYVQTDSFETVIEHFSKDYEVDHEFLNKLIDKAIKINLLVNPNYQGSNKKREFELFNLIFLYLFNIIINFINKYFRINIIPEFTGNVQLYKLFSIEFSNTLFERIFRSKFFQIFVIALYCPFIFYLSYLSISSINNFSFIGFTKGYNFLIVFLGIFISITITMFFHEVGHYFMYKTFGGTANKIGAGLLYIFIPVMYTNIVNIHFWKNKWKKLLVSFAGVLIDILLFLILLVLINYYQIASFFTFLLDILFIYMGFRIVTNLNFLMPGTDGYYMFSDLLGIERLYGKSYGSIKLLFSNLKIGKINISFNQSLLILYFIISNLIVIVYCLMIFSLIFSPLIIKLI